MYRNLRKCAMKAGYSIQDKDDFKAIMFKTGERRE